MKKLAIIVPAHNEEKRIRSLLDSYLPFFRQTNKLGLKSEIIIVLNACTDNTKKIVESYKAKEIRILDFERGGKGFAVIEGFKEALKHDFDFIGFVDADAATSPIAFYNLYLNIKGHDGVIASRYVKGAVINPPPSIKRRILSRLYNAVLRGMLVLPYRDTQCGAKLFIRKALTKTIPKLSMSQWAFDVELLYVANKFGLKVLESPTVWADKEYSKVDSTLRVGFMMFLGIVRLRIINSPFSGLIRVYDYAANLIQKVLR